MKRILFILTLVMSILLFSVQGATSEPASYFENEIMPALINWGSVVLGVVGATFVLYKKFTVLKTEIANDNQVKNVEVSKLTKEIKASSITQTNNSEAIINTVLDLIRTVDKQQESILNLITLVEAHETDRINTTKKYEIISNALMIALGLLAENEQLVRSNISIEMKKVIEDAKTRANEL